MPYWMWIGRQDTQFNATPATNLTARENDAIAGYTATGRDGIAPVMMDGETLGGRFQATFNSSYGIKSGHGGTAMSYTSPETGVVVSNAFITTGTRIDLQVIDLDADGNEYVVGSFRGAFLQMDNGDTFTRPLPEHLDDWSAIARIYRIKVITSERVPDNTAIHQEIGYYADIADVEIVICFLRGTRIRTVAAEVPIQSLRAGDLVETGDHGPQPVRWTGSRRLGRPLLDSAPHLRPVRIRSGALGPGHPDTDLVVSPQHRVLVRSKIALRMFGTDEVLVAARQLLDLDGIGVADDLAEVEYHHLLFDRHEIIFANGAACESLFTGPMAFRSVGARALEEIFMIFPDLRHGLEPPSIARQQVTGRRARRMVERHVQASKPFFS